MYGVDPLNRLWLLLFLLFSLFFVCLHAHVWAHVCVWVHQTDIKYRYPHHTLRQAFLLEFRARWVGSGRFLVTVSQVWGSQATIPTWHVCGCWGSKLRSSHLPGKSFLHTFGQAPWQNLTHLREPPLISPSSHFMFYNRLGGSNSTAIIGWTFIG